MSKAEMKKVLAAHRGHECPRQTRYYAYIAPRKSGEVTITTYAVRDYKKGTKIVPVNRFWSDRDEFAVQNVWSNVWCQRMVEFDECRNRKGLEGQWYEGRWGERQKLTEKSDVWLCPIESYVNIDALAETKYKYCAYTQYNGVFNLAQYLRLYSRHKVVESFAKMGLSRFVKESFISKLEKDKKFERFFRSCARNLNGHETAYDIVRAYKNGWTPAEASLNNALLYSYQKLPMGVDRRELHLYLTKNHIQYYDWLTYINDVRYVDGEGYLAYGVTFPRDLHASAVEAARRKMDLIATERREAAERRRKEEAAHEKRILAVSKRLGKSLKRLESKLAWRIGCMDVVLPSTREEFQAEGRAMHNCIGGYYGRTDSFCFFIRKDGQPFIDCQASNGGKILQCYQKNNAGTSAETKVMAGAIAKLIAKEMKRKCA